MFQQLIVAVIAFECFDIGLMPVRNFYRTDPGGEVFKRQIIGE